MQVSRKRQASVDEKVPDSIVGIFENQATKEPMLVFKWQGTDETSVVALSEASVSHPAMVIQHLASLIRFTTTVEVPAIEPPAAAGDAEEL